MATGYKDQKVCKRLVLPLPSSALSVEEYKAEYGIDLKDFLVLKDNFIYFDAKGSEILLTKKGEFVDLIIDGAFPVIDAQYQEYLPNDTAGFLYLGIFSYQNEQLSGLAFTIDDDKEYSIESIVITTLVYA